MLLGNNIVALILVTQAHQFSQAITFSIFNTPQPIYTYNESSYTWIYISDFKSLRSQPNNFLLNTEQSYKLKLFRVKKVILKSQSLPQKITSQYKDNCSSLSPTFKICYNPTKEPIVKVTNFFKKCLSPIRHSVSCYITQYQTNGLGILKEPKQYVEPLQNLI